MSDRPPRPQTNYIGQASKLQVQVGGQSVIVPITDRMLIGRSTDEASSEDLAIDLGAYGGYQSGVSRQHAVLTRKQGSLYIEDLESTNGSRINGFQLTPRRHYRLRDGDEVEFGRLRVMIRFLGPSQVDGPSQPDT